MMKKFFEPRKRKKQEIDLTNSGEVTSDKAKKTKKDPEETNKRGLRNGFSPATTKDRIKLMEKYPPKGNWRRFDSVIISYTEIIQTWTNEANGKSHEIWHFCPWGMRETIGNRLKANTCKAKYVDFLEIF